MANSNEFERNGIISEIAKKYPPLSFDEERSMIDEYLSKNDRDGLNEKLIMHNVLMMYTAARGWLNIYDMDDFISFGLEGLQLAAEKFDPSRNIKFASFCTYPIKTVMRNHVREYINKISVNSVSLDAPVMSDDGSSATYENFVDSDIKTEIKDSMHSSMADVEDKDSMKHVFTMIKNMGITDKEFDCLVMLFVKDMKLEDIGKVYGRTRERARQIINKALSKIRRAMMTKYDIPYTVLQCPSTEMFRIKRKGCSDSHLEWNPATRRYDVKNGASWYNSDIDWAAYDKAHREYNHKKYELIKQMIVGSYIGEGIKVKQPLKKLAIRPTVVEECSTNTKKTSYTLPSGLKVMRV